MTHSNHNVFPTEVTEQFADVGIDLVMLFSAGKLGERMGIRVTHAEPERVVATMPVGGNTQPYGLLHGGASAVLAETLGSVGAMLHAGPHRIAVGVDLNVTHHRAAGSGEVTGVATPLHRGRSTATYEIVITDDNDKRICTGRITCLIKDTPALPGHPTNMRTDRTGLLVSVRLNAIRDDHRRPPQRSNTCRPRRLPGSE